MAKIFKLLIGLILLLVVVVIVAPMVIDPNEYREQIENVVEEKTGRKLSINGDLKLSVFPWIGVGINEVTLSNAAGFKAETFAQIKRANVKVKLLPLLSKQVEVSAIVLEGLHLNLEKNAAGVTNWDDLSQSKEKSEPSVSSSDEESSGTGIGALAIGGLQIEDANVTWDDASKGERYAIADLDLKTGSLSIGSPMPVTLAFTVDSNKPKTTARLKLSGDLVVNATLDKFDFQNMIFIIDAAGEPIPGGAMKIDIASHLIADLSGNGLLTLNPLSIRFDETTISGKSAVKNLTNPAISFNLQIDTIDVDRYLAKPEAQAKAEGESQVKLTTPAPATAALLPIETLRGLNLDGKIDIQSLRVNGLKVEDTTLAVKAKRGVITTQQAVKKFYGGSYSGSTIIDVRGRQPVVKVAEQAQGIQIEGMLTDMLGEAALSGTANLMVNLSTRGNSIPAFKSALNGRTEFSVNDGAFKGLDAEAWIKKAQQVLKGDASALTQQGGGETSFSEMSGTALISDGLITNADLLAASAVLNIQGKGTADLVSEKLNYRLGIKRTKALEADETADKEDLKNTTIPINITGTFSQPSISIDVQAMLLESQRGKIDEKKAELKEKLNKKLDGFFQKLNKKNEKESTEVVKPEEEAKPAQKTEKDDKEDKKINAGDLLKGLF